MPQRPLPPPPSSLQPFLCCFLVVFQLLILCDSVFHWSNNKQSFFLYINISFPTQLQNIVIIFSNTLLIFHQWHHLFVTQNTISTSYLHDNIQMRVCMPNITVGDGNIYLWIHTHTHTHTHTLSCERVGWEYKHTHTHAQTHTLSCKRVG